MPRPKTPSPWRPPRISHLLPPLLLLLAGSSLPLAHAAPRPAAVPVAGVVVPGHNNSNTTTEPCRPRPHVADSARGKMAVGEGGGGGGGTTAGPPCGFYDGDPARPLVPPAGMGCSVDEAARVWGFCPAVRGAGGSFVDPGPPPRWGGARSFASSAPCKLTTTCYDAFACKEGCGVADEGGSDAVDEAVHGVDEGIKGDDGENEDEDKKGRGGGDVARHLARLSGRSLARVMCPQHDASKYCNMAVWIRRDDARFTSLTCGTAAGSTTSIYESPRTTAVLTTTTAAAAGGGGSGPGGDAPSAAPTSPTTLHSHSPPPSPTETSSTGTTSATTAMTTTATPPLDNSDPGAPADHAGERGRVAGGVAGALAGVALAASAALFVAYRRTRHRFAQRIGAMGFDPVNSPTTASPAAQRPAAKDILFSGSSSLVSASEG
ncbi:hypothetical protein RB597_006256 [Gaeumannomyces tritici]